MRILFVVTALFLLAGCESIDFVAVDYHNGYNYGPYVRPVGHISYTLGYYSGSYYNGYQVYGSHGHRYYHAPRHYSHHRHFARPVVVQHVHVHTSYCEHTVRPRNHYTPPRHTPPRHTPPRQHTRNDRRPQHRDVTPTPQPRHTPPARQRQHVVPPQPQRQVQNRRVDREERTERRRDQKRKHR